MLQKSHRRRLVLGRVSGLHLALVGVLVGVALLGGRSAAQAVVTPTCSSSGPSGGSYTVNVCITDIEDGATVTGPTAATATATFTGTASPGIRRIVFTLDGADLLTDYQAPYTFTLPTQKFADGVKVLQVHALLRDGFESSMAAVSLTFDNGNLTPPVNNGSFTINTGGSGPGSFVVAAAGDGAGGEQGETDTTNLIASWDPNVFLYLGDVYENGTSTEFYNWYGAENSTFYGRFRSITDPTVGNHEYTSGDGAAGYFDYWDNVPHYYSFDAHGWHFISLDANNGISFHQTSPGTPQYQWLTSDLDANTQPCTLVYYHQPLFNIGQEESADYMASIWSLLVQHSVDLVVNGHDHTYQRWQPLDGNGVLSPAGVTQIIAGAGGHAAGPFVTTDSRVAASVQETLGALRLDLGSAGATYQFISSAGDSLDSGSVQCDPNAVDTASPTVPTNVTATATYKTRIDVTWTASTDNVGVTGYDIYRDGQPFTTIGPQTSYSDASVLPGTTHTYKVRARDAASNTSVFSDDASATTPTVAVLFHDGFESGDLSNWTTNNGLAVQQSQVFAGSYAAEATATGGAGASAFKNLAQSESDLFYVARFKILSQSQNVNVLRFRNNTAGANAIATAFVSSTSKLGLRNDFTGVASTSTTTSVTAGWHTLQVHVTTNGASSSTEVWLDGNTVASLTQSGIDLGTAPVGRLELGDPSTARTFDVAFDEVAYDRELIGDLLAPTPPTNLVASAHSGLEIDLAWTPGADDVGVTGYDVYRNDQLITSIPAASSYADKTVSPLQSYTYRLVAKDAAGNVSGFSNVASASTGDVFTDDFETGDVSKWTSVSGLGAQQAVVDGGQWAARATSNGAAGASAQVQLDSTVDELYYRARVKVVGQGANSVSLLRFRSAANGALASAFVSSNGKLGYRNDTDGTFVTSNLSVSSNTWHEVQLHLLVNGASSHIDLWLDGISAVSQDDTLGTTPIGRLELGDPATARTFDVAFDNVVADPAFVADAAPPTPPTNLHTTAVLAHEVDLAWDAANDDVGVTGYRIYRDAATIAEVDGATLAYADTGLADATAHTYTITAVDAAGHESTTSDAVASTTSDGTAPTSPDALTAVAASGQNRIDLSWGPSDDNVGVTGYRIYRDGGNTPIDTVGGTTTTYSDTTVAPVTQYTYTVTAVDATGNESASSNSAAATSSDTVAPAAPTIVTATVNSDSQITVEWSGASDNVGVTGYRIYRNGDITPIDTVDGAATSYSDTTVAPVTQYTYTVTALDDAGNESAASGPATGTTGDGTAPTSPVMLSAVAATGPNRIDLSWGPSSDNVGVTGYRIYRNGGGTPIDTVGGTATSYSDTTVAPATQYTYTVTAVDAVGNESGPSNAAAATTSDTVAPAAPTTVTATVNSDSQITVQWSGASDNVGVTGYQIFRDGAVAPLVAVGASPTTYVDTGLTGGTTYSYAVKTVDAAGNVSPSSASTTATTAVFGDGFEAGNLSRWTPVNGLRVQNTNVYAGSWAAQATSTKNAAVYAVKTLPSTHTSLYYRLRLKILSGKPSTVDVLRFRTATGTNRLALFYDNKRRLGYQNDVAGTTTSSTTTLSTGVWYELKVRLVINPINASTGQVEVWVNGTKVTALSKTDNLGIVAIGQVVAGESTTGRAYDYAIDEVLVDTKP